MSDWLRWWWWWCWRRPLDSLLFLFFIFFSPHLPSSSEEERIFGKERKDPLSPPHPTNIGHEHSDLAMPELKFLLAVSQPDHPVQILVLAVRATRH